jgi:hypothetical protein
MADFVVYRFHDKLHFAVEFCHSSKAEWLNSEIKRIPLPSDIANLPIDILIKGYLNAYRTKRAAASPPLPESQRIPWSWGFIRLVPFER